MILPEDIRWKQRLHNYTKALRQLEKFVAKKNLSDLEQQGLIKAFEYTYELGWNTLKDYLEYQGATDLSGSRDVIREAFRAKLIDDGETWMDMLKSRNLTSHSYNEDTATEIADAILNRYFAHYTTLEQKLLGIAQLKLDL
jgi:nucleotidyltransferase substrate binding protein (TIGR01987 family)